MEDRDAETGELVQKITTLDPSSGGGLVTSCDIIYFHLLLFLRRFDSYCIVPYLKRKRYLNAKYTTN